MVMKKTLRILPIVMLLMFSGTTAVLGQYGWTEGGATVDLADTASVPGIYAGARKRSNTALAISENGEVAVIWSREDKSGLVVARRNPSSGAWSQTVLAVGTEAWYPDVTYAGSDLLASWMQGTFDAQPAPNGDLMQQNVGGASATMLKQDLYGYMGPHLAVGEDGSQHLIFALSDSSTAWIQGKGDLYYSQRTSGGAWTSPTAIITGDLVLENPGPLVVGGIWFPDMALSPDGQTVHLIWEQRIQSLDGIVFQVWYVRGTQTSGTLEILHTTLQRISPPDQRAGRPAVAVDEQGHVHITWTEITGNEDKPGNEYIHYRRVDLPAHTTLTEEAVLVNVERPAWTTSVLAARGPYVCAAWDSFPLSEGAGVGKEEVSMRCSRNGGAQWDNVSTILSETDDLSIFPDFAFDSQEQVHLIWEEHQGGAVTQNYNPWYRGGDIPRLRLFLPLVLRSEG